MMTYYDGYNEYEGWIKDKMNKEQVGRGQVVLYLRNNLMLGSKQRVRKNVNLQSIEERTVWIRKVKFQRLLWDVWMNLAAADG